jgi:hypothetical protein
MTAAMVAYGQQVELGYKEGQYSRRPLLLSRVFQSIGGSTSQYVHLYSGKITIKLYAETYFKF